MPERTVINHGTEFTSKALDQWAYENKVTLHFITPGRPMENGYIESFHGRFREECLNEHWFLTLDDARRTIENWRHDYNRLRPHSSLGYLTPEEFRMIWLAPGITDMRRGSHGLGAQVQTVLEQEPDSGHVFVFRGRRGDLIKLLWFDGDGLCLFQKRLERGRASSGRNPAVEPYRSAALSCRCCSKASAGEDRTAHGSRRWRCEPDLILDQLWKHGILPGRAQKHLAANEAPTKKNHCAGRGAHEGHNQSIPP